MCGIAGIFDGRDPEPREGAIRAMIARLAHRGPDGEGVFAAPHCTLGHRRLAIIDLTDAGRQPMTTPDGRFTIAYNGEVYNFRELRKELEAEGVPFRTRTDTEVVLHACARWGDRAVERFNGMFAFALWDRDRRSFLLARDRYGIKPLYYVRDRGRLIFASEIKALLAHPGVAADLNPEALVEYFTFQNFFGADTLFRGIRILPAGCTMRAGLDEPEPAIARYWDFRFREPDHRASDEESAEELQRLFRRAVERQLYSDVPIGSYLSGGVDSGSITAVASSRLEHLTTFTVGVDLHSASGLELGFDEREAAEHLSYLYQTEHYEMVLKAGDMERALPAMVRHLEEPRIGQSYPNFYAAKLAGKFVKVVLSGCGGDEIFGGYPWRYFRAVRNDDFEHYIDNYFSYWQRLVPSECARRIFAPIEREVEHVSPRDLFRSVFGAVGSPPRTPEEYIHQSLFFEAKTFLHGLLVVEDKLSMAHGLETRLPFLDNDLVDFAMEVSAHARLGQLGEVIRMNENEPGSKAHHYFLKTRDGKLILRRAMQGVLPKEASEGEKKGFSAPDASWFRGESIDYVRRRLYRDDARIYDYLDRATVQSLLQRHLEGRENLRLLIWSLLTFESWCETFLR